MKTILIQNYHPTATSAIVKDFLKIGYRVLAPDSNWGRIGYYQENSSIGAELISALDYLKLPAGDLLISCIELQDDMLSIGEQHKDRIILNTGQNSDPYRTGISDYAICSDIQFYRQENTKRKMLYFIGTNINNEDLTYNVEQKYLSKDCAAYIHHLAKFFPHGYNVYKSFEALHKKTELFGEGSDNGKLEHLDVLKSMSKSMFTLHFKEKEAYGLSAIESMCLGTPIVTLESFIQDKTLGVYFLNTDNAIIAKTVEEAVSRVQNINSYEYTRMCFEAKAQALRLTNNTVRQLNLKTFLES